MGTSPGKWIKAVLFRNKSSTSHSSKRTVGQGTKRPTKSDSLVNSCSYPLPANSTRDNTSTESGADSSIPTNAADITLINHDAAIVASAGSSTSEKERAAVKTQAAFRGYMAHRAFHTLRGIIRLQALIRGHLVRRQALATLFCIHAIVKFQALARGQKDSKQTDSFRLLLKKSSNAFVCKLLSLKTVALPLQMHYVQGGPNSAWKWLERWTCSQIWKPLPQSKKTPDKNPQRNAGYAMETESGRSKRIARKNISVHSNSGSTGIDAKHNLKKVVSLPAMPVQDNSPSSELEKVKRNLRKVTNSVGKSDQSELEIEKPKLFGVRKASSFAVGVPEPEVVDSEEKRIKNNVALANDCKTEEIYPKQSPVPFAETELMQIETTLKLSPENELNVDDAPKQVEDRVMVVNETSNDIQLLNGFDEDNNCALLNKDKRPNEEQLSQETQKTSNRRSSLPSKSEYPKDGTQNTPTLPSYMMATVSAKAKLHGITSPRFSSSDGIEKNSFTRRNSLPPLNNGKIKSAPSQMQRLVQSNGKAGALKSDRSFGHDKPIHVEWRR